MKQADQEFRGFCTPEEENWQGTVPTKPQENIHKRDPSRPLAVFAAACLAVCLVLVLDTNTLTTLAEVGNRLAQVPFDQMILGIAHLMGTLFACGVVWQLLCIARQRKPCQKAAESLAGLIVFLWELIADAIRIFSLSSEPEEKAVRKPVSPGMIDVDEVERLDARLEKEMEAPGEQDEPKKKG